MSVCCVCCFRYHEQDGRVPLHSVGEGASVEVIDMLLKAYPEGASTKGWVCTYCHILKFLEGLILLLSLFVYSLWKQLRLRIYALSFFA